MAIFCYCISMLLIKAVVKTSSIHGLGLFADEAIPKGTRVWEFSPLLDRELDAGTFSTLSEAEKAYILFYGFLSKKSGNYHLSFDNVKFINHAVPGNVATDTSDTKAIEYPLVAVRDIGIGEEILQNYKEFEETGHGL
jgi:uncharacterized protein